MFYLFFGLVVLGLLFPGELILKLLFETFDFFLFTDSLLSTNLFSISPVLSGDGLVINEQTKAKIS